jgi:transcriptional regulator with XRE-family HTH domain
MVLGRTPNFQILTYLSNQLFIIDRKDFGAYLYQLLAVKGLPLSVVADKHGVDLTLLIRIERGERQVQVTLLHYIAEMFSLEFRNLQIQYLQQKNILGVWKSILFKVNT